jgi:hypothetical protein
MKYLILIPLFLLAACDSRPVDQRVYSTQSLKNIPELADCVYIRLENLRIIHCPNSATSTQWTAPSGKYMTTHSAIVIDN